jgi:dUTP pyrophosphatase
MTFKEKLKREHPVRARLADPGCPEDYGYEPVNSECPCNTCEECWNREIPEVKTTSTQPVLKVMLDPGAIMPTRAHKNDGGLDLYATKGGWIFPKSRKVFGTGFHASIPAGFVGLLTSKSGMMLKGITSRGTIDSDYNGEIRAVLFNHSWKFIRIRQNQKISQLVILPIITPDLELVDSLDETERGNGGFGSTGKF